MTDPAYQEDPDILFGRKKAATLPIRGAAAYRLTLSGDYYLPLIESNSMSKIRVELGPMSPPAPRLP
jgi:hypothetical protein